jgi:cysteine desulfurase family protein (TIGR01976 family)
MTSLTFALSRSIGRTLKPGDEIILTRLDHDANYSPWHLMAQDVGVSVHTVDINDVDCTLNLDDFEKHLSHRTKLVAVGCASNAVGTINPLKQIIGMSKAVGALTFLDAVHYAPHGPIDVQDLDCDFLGCSTYKFFAPHMGVMYGRRALLEELFAYKVRPADDHLPSKFETGTQNHEHLAGLIGTFDYLEWLGKTYSVEVQGQFRSKRSEIYHQAYEAIKQYEMALSKHMLDGLDTIPGCKVYGITDRTRLHQRTPTFGIRVEGKHPHEIAAKLGEQGVCVWDGNYYAINLTERLGVEGTGGMVRVGFAHYNTMAEIDRFIGILHTL